MGHRSAAQSINQPICGGDIANEYLNGEKTTNYGNGTYATLAAADTVATKKAIDTLVDAPTFTITTTPDIYNFSIMIGAAGNFTIDWGDGKRDVITKTSTAMETYSHTYSASGEYEIKLSGRATDYSNAATDAAVSFHTNSSNIRKVSNISGSLGKIFPTLPDGSQPSFYQTFYYAINLTEIPADLFAGIHGAPAEYMFYDTFRETAITEIPAGLFAGIQGAPAEGMFYWTFSYTEITEIPADLFAGISGDPAESMFKYTFLHTDITEIPAGLFAGIQGAPVAGMFDGTFWGTQITEIPANLFAGIQGGPVDNIFNGTFQSTNITEIPADLFAGIQGAPAEWMFSTTFYNCTQLQSIPENLFAGISGPAADSMFRKTFYDCTSLTGPSARINGQYLYEIWPDVSILQTYGNATGLSDYDQIPDDWK